MLKHFFSPLPGSAGICPVALLALLALSLGLAPAAFGQVTFASAMSYGVGATPYSVAVGDFNGDGKPDLAVANYADNNVSVLLNTGTGTFATAVRYQAMLYGGPRSVAVGDFNGDGKPDLATANTWNNVRVSLNTGTGSFAPAVTYGAGSGPYELAVGDLNSDGRSDLVTANTGDNTVSVLLNTTAITGLATVSALRAAEVSVYPNPVTGRFTVTLPAIAGARTVEATLLNSLGQVVRRQSASLSAGGTHFDVVADGLGAGVYSLRLSAGASTLTKRVVLQ